MTLSFTALLAPGTKYRLLVDAGSFKTVAGAACDAAVVSFSTMVAIGCVNVAAGGVYNIDVGGGVLVSTYCEPAAANRGAWALLAYAQPTFPGPLTASFGSWTPATRTGAATFGPLALVQSSPEVAFTLRSDGVVATGGLSSYSFGYTMQVPDPGAQTLTRPSNFEGERCRCVRAGGTCVGCAHSTVSVCATQLGGLGAHPCRVRRGGLHIVQATHADVHWAAVPND